jgi:hypothetical protein
MCPARVAHGRHAWHMSLACFARLCPDHTMRGVMIGGERRMVDKDQRVLDDALRTLLSGTRGALERQTAVVERLEVDLAAARKELEYQRQLAEVLERESRRRNPGHNGAEAGKSGAHTGEASLDAVDVSGSEADSGRLSRQDAEALRGPTRLECALSELRSTGLNRPVVARDVALRYSGICDKKQREGARSALVSAVADGKAVRLTDGSFLPTRLLVPDLPEHIAVMADAAIPAPRVPETEVEPAA